jgi:Sensors of blue-light using FAD
VTYQIIYSSKAETPMQTDDLQELLDHARRSNAAKSITGALVYAEGIFIQILEGDKLRVIELMAKIRQDVRHANVSVLREGEVPTASFGSWKMAYVSATPKQVAQWAGVSVANDITDTLNETAEEQKRTAQFAQDILSLLVADDTIKGKGQ